MSTVILIHLSYIAYLIAMPIRDQLIMRILLAVGTGFAAAYYLTLPNPLVVTFGWNVAIFVVNVIVIAVLWHGRRATGFSKNEKQLYQKLAPMTPGQFRKLMRITEWLHVDQERSLTLENRPVDALYYIVAGQVVVKRDDRDIIVNSGAFIGELGIELDQTASATTVAQPDSIIVRWERSQYQDFMSKQPNIKVIFDAALKIDLAKKLYA